jgi:ribonuclease G
MSAVLPIDEILFAASPGETRAALVSEGRLVELIIERAERGSLVGNIYLGRVTKLVPSMEAAFIDLGEPRPGFLARGDATSASDKHGASISQLVSEGEVVRVQVTKDAFGEKGPRLSTAAALAGHRLVLMPARGGLAISRRITDDRERARLEEALAPRLVGGEGVVVRTAAEGADQSALLDELAALRKQWQEIAERAAASRAPAILHAEPDLVERVLREHAGAGLRRVFCDSREARGRAGEFLARHGASSAVEVVLHQGSEPLFARHEVEDQIASALEREVALPSGGRLVIGTLEALTAIDVDTARHAGAGRFEDTVLAVNLEAAEAAAQQVRLRNLAGLIVIDFVHMERAAHRARVADALRGAFAADPVSVQFGGFTSLGLFELTRKRVRAPLAETLGAPCEACHGAGELKSAETVAYELLRAAERTARATPGRSLSAFAAASVVAALESGARPARETLERQLGRPLTLRAEPAFGRERFEIVAG